MEIQSHVSVGVIHKSSNPMESVLLRGLVRVVHTICDANSTNFPTLHELSDFAPFAVDFSIAGFPISAHSNHQRGYVFPIYLNDNVQENQI